MLVTNSITSILNVDLMEVIRPSPLSVPRLVGVESLPELLLARAIQADRIFWQSQN
jgi:hypothetical protein